ncbi:unnamed protein product [Effrenium voratum]|uniref:Fatty acid hydroxylase domain-containing protein n=1 Tax=Effrenium voratum TaxID=2562239 RepID=A0AA36IQ17_9DINO|nr:unnamed protein product [Effrenium voratum]CAJ1390764.1 unnamed protein product [Effrenium voratum]CAJ1451668.1 unnamed protein product [Effrenium voratum]CAJ1454107.1 unnamed protein product [Effrenium voratum]
MVDWTRLGGLPGGQVFGGVETWVDRSKPAGCTSQVQQLGLENTLRQIVTFKYFFYSPNLVWCILAMAVYVAAPYDISAATSWSWSWVLPRLCLNFAVALAYYGFFYFGLYVSHWSSRKFAPDRFPTSGNMAHNLYYWSLGILQWTLLEALMMRLWATGKVPYVTAADIISKPVLLCLNVFWVLAMPVWRDLHFYIAHRFIHIRAVYKYVHSLHHRNSDPEPFSGLTMHPIEHLYYYSNAFFPALYLSGLSPFLFYWCFFHLAIAPACGHSGFEDHFQSDQYHYCHHAKFECNYGSPMSGFIDQWCGTFREKLGESKEYKGEFKEESKGKSSKIWAPESYLGMPKDMYHGIYTVFWASMVPLVALATQHSGQLLGFSIAQLTAGTVAFGPVLLALALCHLSGDKLSWRWPFQKERLLGQFGLFLTLGYLACLLPIYHAVSWSVAAGL